MSTPTIVDPAEVWALCLSCAREIYGLREPTPQYADRTARLLFGTAAIESDGFKAARQYDIEPDSELGIEWEENSGGFGFWQLEWGSINNSIRRLGALDKQGWLRARCAQWLFRSPNADPDWLTKVALNRWAWLHFLCGWDRLACLFARLHYMWVPEPIPPTSGEQAGYWKRYYNSPAGKGTPQDYLRFWVQFEKITRQKGGDIHE